MLHLISFPPETVNPVKADIRNPLRYLLITVKIIHRGSYFSESSTCEPIRSQKSQNCKQKFSLFLHYTTFFFFITEVSVKLFPGRQMKHLNFPASASVIISFHIPICLAAWSVQNNFNPLRVIYTACITHYNFSCIIDGLTFIFCMIF